MRHINTLPFGQTLLVWRHARGLTQTELARRAMVPRPNLSAIEQGKREVHLGTVRALAVGLGIQPGILVDGISPYTVHARGKNLSRSALERIAEAVVQGTIPDDSYEQVLVASIRAVMRYRASAIGCRRHVRGRTRAAERAWLTLASACSPEVAQSLFQRVVDRLGRHESAAD